MANVSILAIIGHATRGKEVIEILKMMGGKNFNDVKCNYPDRFYFVLYGYVYWQDFDLNKIDKFQIFTLEQFLERYPFKVGDFVSIPEYESEVRISEMKWCPLSNCVEYMVYRCDDEEWYTAEELLDYNEPHKEETSKATFEGNAQCCDIMNDIIKDNTEKRKYAELRMPLDDDDKLSTEVTIDGNKIFPPNNYLIGKVTQVDNGMLVEFVKKQPKYPNMYVECCEVLGIGSYFEPEIRNTTTEECRKFMAFMRLIRCRNAYWKIAGEQMGLGKSWEPDWEDYKEYKYCLYIVKNKVNKGIFYNDNHILTFPTEEMRDVFFENFKDLIEICKELL